MPKINLDETREYDLNVIMQKAKSAKEVNYEEDRLKKLRNTQYDILKNLNINHDEDEKITEDDDSDYRDSQKLIEGKNNDRPVNSKEKQLVDLINTITAKELLENDESTQELDPLDILSDLRGDDESTKVMGAIEQDKLEKANSDDVTVIEVQSDKNFDKTQNSEITEVVKAIANSDNDTNVITTLRNSDYEDFSDLRQDMKVTKILIKIFIVIIILVFIAGCVILVNKLFNLGLF